MDNLVEMTVFVPVSQYVKVEAAADEDSRSLESTASFLLSKWVASTQERVAGESAKHSLAVRTARSVADGRAEV